MEINYDNQGRITYQPEFHFNHKKPFTVQDLEYLCKYWEHDDRRSLSYALGRTETTLSSKVQDLKKQGLYEYYKNLNKYYL